jgi:beta-phosphoglucomutase-like phosphatase (HAD superfamily)
MRIDSVIFDFDGTLADSEPNYYEADRLLMAEYGIDFTFEMKKEFIGRGNSGMMKTLHERYNLPGTVEDMIRRKNELYLEIALKNTPIYPEMLAFIKMLVSECVLLQ